MKKKLSIILASLLLLSGCGASGSQDQGKNLDKPGQQVETNKPGNTDQGQPTPGNEQGNKDNQRVSLGKIHLGDPFSQVEQILGKDYKETLHEEPGHFPEAWYSREYTKGIKFVVGKDSGKVLEIDAVAGDFPTNLGVKVGDSAEKVSQQYGSKYKPFESRHGDGPLEGFYQLEEDLIIIFDYNKDDDQLFNKDVKPDSKVEMIRLTQSKYLD